MNQPRHEPRYGQPNFEYISRMAATPPEEDGPVFMVNLMKYRQKAAYVGGNEPERSGREADDIYAPTDILRDIGARIVFIGDVTQQLLGAPTWDRIGVVRYPTRRAFLDMQRRGDFKEKHVHKDAGMEQTIVLSCTPLAVPELPEPPAHELAPGDAPFVMLHVLKFAEGGEAGMADYGASAGAVGLQLGVRPEAMLKVEGTVVGDGRMWDQVRFNRFPSKAIFQQLTADPVHRAGQAGRAASLEDTYAMMVSPTRDHMAEAIRAQSS